MKLTIDLDDAVLSRAVTEHLTNKDVVREAVGKAFNKSDFVEMFSKWLRGEFTASLKSALADDMTKQALAKAVGMIQTALIEETVPSVVELRNEIRGYKDRLSERDAGLVPKNLHPALVRRLK